MLSEDIIFSYDNSTILKEISEPNWNDLVYSYLPKSVILKSKDIQYNYLSPYSFFLKGVSFEYGVVTNKNLDLAYESYLIGAERNDSFCNLRLFFIHFTKNREFKFVEYNNDEALFYLFSAYAFYSENDEPRFRINIENILEVFRKYDKNFMEKSDILFEKFQFRHCGNFVKNNFNMRFSSDSQRKNEALKNLFDQSDFNKCKESNFLLGLIYNGLIKGNANIDIAVEFFKLCSKNLMSKSYFINCKLLWVNGKQKEAIDLAFKGASSGCYKCNYFLGCQLLIKNGNSIDCVNNFQK